MKLILKVWRQDGADDEGRFEIHQLDGVSEDSSFLEMMDQLNEQLLEEVMNRYFSITTVVRDLRNLFSDYQRISSWTREFNHHLPVAHAEI